METSDRVSVIFPVGMLGGGFPAATIQRGIDLGADAIAVDAGSTDSGPHYLGTGTAKAARAAVRRDLEILLTSALDAAIPLVITSCGTSGTDAGVDWIAEILTSIATEHAMTFRYATLYSELDRDTLHAARAADRIHPLPPLGALDPDTLDRCTHIVGLMGAEPIAEALDAGAQVVLTGRATDTASVAALALRSGLPPGPSWHAAKTVECGGLCTTDPRGGGVLVHIDRGGFTVEPLAEHAACTPTTVAAHMIYENADPFRLTEPSGVLDTSGASYTALDERRVRVTGSRFEPAPRYTVKLEGAALAGYETLSFVGIRDPHVVSNIDQWIKIVSDTVAARAESLAGLTERDFQFRLRTYGANAVLGSLEPETAPVREVGVLLQVRADTQDTATAIAKIANPILLHAPLPDMDHLPSFAFAVSPAEVERGATYEFVLNHVVEVDTPCELFRSVSREAGHV